jgi:hypothetical protein
MAVSPKQTKVPTLNFYDLVQTDQKKVVNDWHDTLLVFVIV